MIIERNLGNAERCIRLMLGLAFLAWAATRPALSGIELFVVAISLCLMLNGLFSRCYAWYLLELNTCESGDESCHRQKACL